MKETGFFDTVDDNIIYRPGKYTIKGDRAQDLYDRYRFYADPRNGFLQTDPDLHYAGQRAVESFKKSAETPSATKEEKAPSKRAKDLEKEVSERVNSASLDSFPDGWQTLSEEELEEKIRDDYKALIQTGPTSSSPSAQARFDRLVAETEDGFAARRLSEIADYKLDSNELARLQGREFPFPEAEIVIDESSPTPSDSTPTVKTKLNKEFDLSVLEERRKARQAAAEAAAQFPTNTASWESLDDFIEKALDSLGGSSSSRLAQVDVIAAVKKVQDSRQKYLSEPSDANKNEHSENVKNLLRTHQSSIISGRYIAIPYKSDGVLTPREIAELNAPFQKEANSEENLRRAKAPTVTESYNKAVADLRRDTPALSQNQLSNIPGKWSNVSVEDRVSQLEQTARDAFRNAFSNADVNDRQRDVIIKNLVASNIRTFMTSRSNYAEIKNDDTGDIVRLYKAPRSTSGGLIGDQNDLRLISESLDEIRKATNLTTPIKVSLVAPGSKINEMLGQTAGARSLGFAFPGAGTHILPQRLLDMIRRGNSSSGEYNPDTSWHSVPQPDYETAFKHTAIHEIGHVLMYQFWGRDNVISDGKTALANDYRTFGVSGQKISRYGAKNVAEHFAEAYARYVMTGDATPEFRNLLASKGLLKSQQGEN